MGFSPFSCACICFQENESVLHNFFVARNSSNQWWHGLGYTSWVMIKIPIIVYVVMRVLITFCRLWKKRFNFKGKMECPSSHDSQCR